VTVYDQLQRALSAEGIDGSLQHVLLTLRMHNDTAHLSIRHAPSEAEAQQWLETEGRQFREPVAVGYIQGNDAPVQLPPPKVIESSESISGIDDGANIWRGYGRNTRGVIKFRRGRFVGEVNAPSVKDATVVAKGVAALLA
jgi:hypothetical protein